MSAWYNRCSLTPIIPFNVINKTGNWSDIMADSPEKKKEPKHYEVINRDKNGKIIPDLSKVILSKELSREIIQIINRY